MHCTAPKRSEMVTMCLRSTSLQWQDAVSLHGNISRANSDKLFLRQIVIRASLLFSQLTSPPPPSDFVSFLADYCLETSIDQAYIKYLPDQVVYSTDSISLSWIAENYTLPIISGISPSKRERYGNWLHHGPRIYKIMSFRESMLAASICLYPHTTKYMYTHLPSLNRLHNLCPPPE